MSIAGRPTARGRTPGAVVRRGKASVAAPFGADVFGQRKGISARLTRSRIERLRHQRVTSRAEQQMAGGVGDGRLDFKQRGSGFGRSSDATLIFAGLTAGQQIPVGAPCRGNDGRPAGSAAIDGWFSPVAGSSVVTLRSVRRRRSRHACEARRRRSRRRTGSRCRGSRSRRARRGVAQHDRRSAGDRHFLQLAGREERDEPAVGRPERKGAAFGSRRSARRHGAPTGRSQIAIRALELPATNTTCRPSGETGQLRGDTGAASRRAAERRVLRRRDRELHGAGCGRDVAGADMTHGDRRGEQRDRRARRRPATRRRLDRGRRATGCAAAGSSRS